MRPLHWLKRHKAGLQGNTCRVQGPMWKKKIHSSQQAFGRHLPYLGWVWNTTRATKSRQSIEKSQFGANTTIDENTNLLLYRFISHLVATLSQLTAKWLPKQFASFLHCRVSELQAMVSFEICSHRRPSLICNRHAAIWENTDTPIPFWCSKMSIRGVEGPWCNVVPNDCLQKSRSESVPSHWCLFSKGIDTTYIRCASPTTEIDQFQIHKTSFV